MTRDVDFGWDRLPMHMGESGAARAERGEPGDDWDPREEDAPATASTSDPVRRPGGGTPSGPRGPETDGVTTTTD
ncbi:hypothetical protein V3W47_03610 [Deinococcus sp. YIM 134068]|uniref:hypothetical protein n=1 Tax=Deinococcus lichenicola TaxID=3118910 RepID=UPI002F9270DC